MGHKDKMSKKKKKHFWVECIYRHFMRIFFRISWMVSYSPSNNLPSMYPKILIVSFFPLIFFFFLLLYQKCLMYIYKMCKYISVKNRLDYIQTIDQCGASFIIYWLNSHYMDLKCWSHSLTRSPLLLHVSQFNTQFTRFFPTLSNTNC